MSATCLQFHNISTREHTWYTSHCLNVHSQVVLGYVILTDLWTTTSVSSLSKSEGHSCSSTYVSSIYKLLPYWTDIMIIDWHFIAFCMSQRKAKFQITLPESKIMIQCKDSQMDMRQTRQVEKNDMIKYYKRCYIDRVIKDGWATEAPCWVGIQQPMALMPSFATSGTMWRSLWSIYY